MSDEFSTCSTCGAPIARGDDCDHAGLLDLESNRPADEDRAGGRNTMTRRASGDLCADEIRPGMRQVGGRWLYSAAWL